MGCGRISRNSRRARVTEMARRHGAVRPPGVAVGSSAEDEGRKRRATSGRSCGPGSASSRSCRDTSPSRVLRHWSGVTGSTVACSRRNPSSAADNGMSGVSANTHRACHRGDGRIGGQLLVLELRQHLARIEPGEELAALGHVHAPDRALAGSAANSSCRDCVGGAVTATGFTSAWMVRSRQSSAPWPVNAWVSEA